MRKRGGEIRRRKTEYMRQNEGRKKEEGKMEKTGERKKKGDGKEGRIECSDCVSEP